MFYKTEGLFLYGLKYGDSGKIVTLYTEGFGRSSFILQGIHGKKSSGKANLLQPLFQLDIEVDHRNGRELQRAREIRIKHPYRSIPFDIIKSSQAMFIAEILFRVLKEEEARPELYKFLSNSFQIFDLMEEGAANFHLAFLIQLTRYLGFSPENNFSDLQLFFDMVAGNFSDTKPQHPYYLDSAESRIFSEIMNRSYEDIGQLSLDSARRKLFLLKIVDYYSLHLGIRLQLKSLDVLQELFS